MLQVSFIPPQTIWRALLVTYVSYRPFLGAEKRVIQSRESISRGQVALFSMD